MGAAAIWGFPAERSVVKWDAKKLTGLKEKLDKVVQGAAEQSKRNLIPEIDLVERSKELVDSFADFDRVFVAYEESAKAREKSALAAALGEVSEGDRLLFIFGPEGGITDREIEQFTEDMYRLVNL